MKNEAFQKIFYFIIYTKHIVKFKQINVYETIIHQVDQEYRKEQTAEFCDRITFPYENNDQVKVLCRKFVTFLKNLKNNYKSDSNSQAHKKYSEYLNFWIRHQLELQSISQNEKSVLYNHLNDKFEQFNKDCKLQKKLNDINDNDFKSMNMLYKLYKNYNGSLSENNNDCNVFFKKLKVNYDKCLYRCYADENLINLYFFFQYKELNELIWLQYNIPFQHNEEMKKNYMMEILYQFIKYCRENKKNEKLSSFMSEFIVKYYKENYTEYEQIFADCKNGDKSKTYGQLYESCKEKYGEDLALIEKNADKYLEYQINYIKSLSALELWIFKAQSLFQDFDAISRISPTIMSTMVAIVVCVFFLYKVLKTII
ncbi:hypothetical protein PVBG_05912 [Plasmodium vivax Brazil I]|uniref:Uncharacterized protein n=1 Tax=Plasmodium vivax (strain Brazil I) TaxID=1033975 RepID=A0A0J9T300_PLAV1|nr:hypothetical protein PVBG_05912 [Plasmodium vivax Brazil I]